MGWVSVSIMSPKHATGEDGEGFVGTSHVVEANMLTSLSVALSGVPGWFKAPLAPGVEVLS